MLFGCVLFVGLIFNFLLCVFKENFLFVGDSYVGVGFINGEEKEVKSGVVLGLFM